MTYMVSRLQAWGISLRTSHLASTLNCPVYSVLSKISVVYTAGGSEIFSKDLHCVLISYIILLVVLYKTLV